MIVRPFRLEHLGQINALSRFASIRDDLLQGADRYRGLEGPFSWTGVDRQTSKPIACAGIYRQKAHPTWPAMAWAFLSNDAKPHMLSITRRVRQVLDAFPGPVMAEIDPGFPEAVRWATLLGFFPFGRWVWIYDAKICRRR